MHKKHDQPSRGKNNASFESIGYDKTAYDNTASNDKPEYVDERSQIEEPPSNAVKVAPANFYME